MQLGAWSHPLSILPKMRSSTGYSSHASHVTFPTVFTVGICTVWYSPPPFIYSCKDRFNRFNSHGGSHNSNNYAATLCFNILVDHWLKHLTRNEWRSLNRHILSIDSRYKLYVHTVVTNFSVTSEARRTDTFKRSFSISAICIFITVWSAICTFIKICNMREY